MINKNIKKRMKEQRFYNLSLVILVVTAFFILSCSFISGATADSYKPYLHKPSIGQYPKLDVYGTYQTQLFPGSATYSYGIDVSPGTNGLAPQLSLDYNSQSALQNPSIVGAGWSFTSNYIMRSINFTVTNTSDDYYILSLNGYSDKIVFKSGRFNTNIDSYLRIENKTSGGFNYWVITTKDGTQYRFGYSNSSALFSNSSTYQLKWFLDYVNDTHGNTINYSYNKNPYSEDVGAMYLTNITYNRDGLRKIIFRYENSNRPDKRIVYEQGSKFLESRRLNGIEVYFNNVLVRRYNITYTDLNYEKTLSAIANITFIGADNVSELNKVRFEYYDSQPGFENTSKWLIPEEFTSISSGSQDFGARLIDVDNDGFMDFVKSNSTLNYTKLNNKNNTWTTTSYFSVPEQIVNSSNMYQGVILIDVNRDGLTDLLKAKYGETRKTYLNNGTAWLNSTNNYWRVPVDFINGTKDEGVRFVELNGDGLIDIVQGKTSGSVKNSWINNGTNWVSTSLWILPDYFVESDGINETGLREIDLNGDGLTDLIKGGNPGSTWINNGTGWVNDTLYRPNISFTNSTFPDLGVRFIDINGDGLSDIIQGFFNNITYSVLNETCYNLTNSTLNCTNYYSNITSITNIKINNGTGWVLSPYWQSPENFTSNGFNTGRRIADINGDGYADILVGYKNTSVEKKTLLRNATASFMLKKITHEYGGTSYITYNKSSLSNNGRNLGFNLWVVNNVSINNSLNGLFNITGLTKYIYLGGKFDYINSEFAGFSSVNETLSDNTTIAHFFLQTPMLKGKENITRIYDKNNKLINEVFNYYTNTSDNKVFLNFTRQSIYEKNPSALVINITYSYDGYGNLLLANYSGNTALTGDEKYEYYNYTYNTTSYIVDKISNYSLYNSSNILVKRNWFYYDGLTSSVTKGDLSRIVQHNNKGPNPEINYSYDSYGNVIREADSKGNFINYTYDPETNTFIYKKLNPLGHRTNYSYDRGTGNLIYEEKDGLYHNYTYDTFGRVIKEAITPDNSTFPTKRTNYSFDGVSPENITIEVKNNDSSYSEVIYFYDGFANPVQIKTKFNPSVQIVQNYLYDNKFRIIEEQAPTFQIYSKQLNTTSNSFSMRYVYDALDRITNITKPDNSNLSILFNNTKVITTNELGVKKEYFIDAYGRMINVSEHNRNLVGVDEIYNTSYYYDVMDNLVRIVDSYGNNFTYGYDSLGRRISMDDPDTNPWAYSYDANGNLINQTDGRNITTFITYDKLNRMIKKNSSLKTTNITFVYDVQYNGTLSNITLEGNYFLPIYYKYTYDNRLRIIWENSSIQEKEIWGDELRDLTNISINYDSQDRILNMHFPNQTFTYSYNLIGKLENINGFLSSINYNAYGKMINKTYNNGLITNFTYDNLSRVSRIQTGTIQNLSYGYDVVNNIRQINDTKNNISYSMTYDDLERLIKTIIYNYTSFDHNKFTYIYNRIGNVISKITDTLETNFTYNSLAHAPSNVTNYVRISPRLELTTIYPASDINVNQNKFFNYTVQVCCKDNDCLGTNVYLDPQDEGYTPNTQTTCFEERCNKIIYSGTRFVFEDNEWKNIEDARSLKGLLPVRIDEDSKFPVEVIDYNYTSITLNLSIDSHLRVLPVPLMVYNKYNYSKKPLDILGNIVDKDLEIDLNNKKQSQIVTIDLSDTQENILTQEIKWGDASTIITVYDNNSVNMDDATIKDNCDSCNYGSSTRLYIQNSTGINQTSLIKFNLSQIPKQALIEEASLLFYLYGNALESGECYNVSIHRIFSNYSWNEETVNWDNGPTNASFYNSSSLDSNLICDESVSSDGYLSWNVTSSIKFKNNTESFYIFSTYDNVSGVGDDIYFNSKEYLTNVPYLNVTYLLKGVVSTTTDETPFYTNVSNPYHIDLDKDQCKNVNWTVNATGEKRDYIFFAYANKGTNQSIYNETRLVNINIV